MKIECLTTFLDGTDRFESGDVRTIDDPRAVRFIANGWASDPTGTVTSDNAAQLMTDLAIDNSTLNAGDSNG